MSEQASMAGGRWTMCDICGSVLREGADCEICLRYPSQVSLVAAKKFGWWGRLRHVLRNKLRRP